MAAFKEQHIDSMQNRLNVLFSRTQRTNQISLTHLEVVSLCAPKAIQLAMLNAHTQLDLPIHYISNSLELTWEPVFGQPELGIRFKSLGVNHYRPIPPKDPVFQHDADPELIERVTSWVTRRRLIGRDFGLVHMLIHDINECCDSIAHMKFFWPSLEILFGRPFTTPEKQFVGCSRPPRKLPNIPVYMRKAIRQASATLTCTLLLPEEGSITEVETEAYLYCKESGQVEADGGYWFEPK